MYKKLFKCIICNEVVKELLITFHLSSNICLPYEHACMHAYCLSLIYQTIISLLEKEIKNIFIASSNIWKFSTILNV